MEEQVHMDVLKGLARTLGFKPSQVSEILITPTEVMVTAFGEPKIIDGQPNFIERTFKVIHDA